MALQPCNRLGSYEILAAIGAGSMGVVYQSQDTRSHPAITLEFLSEEPIYRNQALESFQRYTLNLHRKDRNRLSNTELVNVRD
jgi:serine/threonine protein kinase